MPIFRPHRFIRTSIFSIWPKYTMPAIRGPVAVPALLHRDRRQKNRLHKTVTNSAWYRIELVAS